MKSEHEEINTHHLPIFSLRLLTLAAKVSIATVQLASDSPRSHRFQELGGAELDGAKRL